MKGQVSGGAGFVDIPMSGLSVMIGIPAGRNPNWNTVMSLVSTFGICQKMNIPCQPGIVKGCAIITKARDEVVHAFLESNCNRLFWIDDDMVWSVDDFLRLLALSAYYPVVGAPYVAKMDRPTFYINAEDMSNLQQNAQGLIDVKGMGLGFTVMQREVVEAVADTKPMMRDQVTGKDMVSVFRTDIHEGHFRGEDMAFFSDIRELGYKVFMDPVPQLGHHGDKVFKGSILDALTLGNGGVPTCEAANATHEHETANAA